MNSRRAATTGHAVENATDLPKDCRDRSSQADDTAAPDNTVQKQRRDPVGTERANYLSPSDAPTSARRWGGSRNSAGRTSDSLSLGQARNIIEAAQFAAAIDLPFNRHITIHWEQAGISDRRAAWATGRFLKLAGDWISKRGGRFAWAWVRENGHRKGSHVHLLLHIPAGLGLGRMQRRWIRSITGKPYCPNTIKTARIGGTVNAAKSAPAAYQANLATVVGYVLKGVTPAAARALGLDRLEPGGRIVGKRAATSQNIGRMARARLK